jgi:hypothetical protein
MQNMTGDDVTQKLHSTTDARVWADEFCKLFSVSHRVTEAQGDVEDETGLMIGWFANAIEIGKDSERNKFPPEAVSKQNE